MPVDHTTILTAGSRNTPLKLDKHTRRSRQVADWQAKQGITKEAEDAYFDGNLPSTTPVASISVEADTERVGVSVGDAR